MGKEYTLNFVKINKENLVAGVGTAGNIWIVLNALLNIEVEDKLYVDMTKEITINTEENEINGTKNPWEYYFNQVKKPLHSIEMDTMRIPSKILYEHRYKHSDKIIIYLQKIFWKNFSLKNDILNEIQEYYDNAMKNKITLGVQIRLTDMKSNHNVKSFNDYVNKTNQILKKNREIEQVFLATDDETIIKEFSEKVSKPVIYLKDIYRATEDKKDLNPYDRYDYIRPKHRYLLGKEVILDIFILSRCNQILKADISCVSQLALIFSDSINKTHFLRSDSEIFLKKIKNKVKRIVGVLYGK